MSSVSSGTSGSSVFKEMLSKRITALINIGRQDQFDLFFGRLYSAICYRLGELLFEKCWHIYLTTKLQVFSEANNKLFVSEVCNKSVSRDELLESLWNAWPHPAVNPFICDMLRPLKRIVPRSNTDDKSVMSLQMKIINYLDQWRYFNDHVGEAHPEYIYIYDDITSKLTDEEILNIQKGIHMIRMDKTDHWKLAIWLMGGGSWTPHTPFPQFRKEHEGDSST